MLDCSLAGAQWGRECGDEDCGVRGAGVVVPGSLVEGASD